MAIEVDEGSEGDETEGGENDEAIAASQLAAAAQGPAPSAAASEPAVPPVPPLAPETPKVDAASPVQASPAPAAPAAPAPRRALGARMPSDDDISPPKRLAEAPQASKQAPQASKQAPQASKQAPQASKQAAAETEKAVGGDEDKKSEIVPIAEPYSDMIASWIEKGELNGAIEPLASSSHEFARKLVGLIELRYAVGLRISLTAEMWYKRYVGAPIDKATTDDVPSNSGSISVHFEDAAVAAGAATMAAIVNDVVDDRPSAAPRESGSIDVRFSDRPSALSRTSKATTSTGGTHRTPPEEIAARMKAGGQEVTDDGAGREPDPPAPPRRSRFDSEIHGDNVEDIDRKKRGAKPRSYDLTKPAAAGNAAVPLKKEPQPKYLNWAILGLIVVTLALLGFVLYPSKNSAPPDSGQTGIVSSPSMQPAKTNRSCEPLTPGLSQKFFGESDPSNYTLHSNIEEPHLSCKGGIGKPKSNGKYDFTRCQVCILDK